MFGMFRPVIKNLFSKPATRMYPVEKREPFKDARGHLAFREETCNFCGLCQLKCPSKCIEVDRKAKKWELNPYACVLCGVCVEACNRNSLSLGETYFPPSTEKRRITYGAPTEDKPQKEVS